MRVVIERTSAGNWGKINCVVVRVLVFVFFFFSMLMFDSLWSNMVDYLSLVEVPWDLVNLLVGGGVLVGIV